MSTSSDANPNAMPTPENQQFSEKTLKGFLLKNVNPLTKDPSVLELNNYLTARVDAFWDVVVVPMKNAGVFNGNKIDWYFEVYKEGLEAHRLLDNPFDYVPISKDTITKIIDHFKGKTITQYCEMGTSFLSNAFSMLSFWHRDRMVLFRLEHIYKSSDAVDWIYAAEAEEKGAMSEVQEGVPGLLLVLNNINMIMKLRV